MKELFPWDFLLPQGIRAYATLLLFNKEKYLIVNVFMLSKLSFSMKPYRIKSMFLKPRYFLCSLAYMILKEQESKYHKVKFSLFPSLRTLEQKSM